MDEEIKLLLEQIAAAVRYGALFANVENAVWTAINPYAAGLRKQLDDMISAIKGITPPPQPNPPGPNQSNPGGPSGQGNRFGVGDNVFHKFLGRGKTSWIANKLIGGRVAKSISSGKFTRALTRSFRRGGLRAAIRSPHGKIAAGMLAGGIGGGAAAGRAGMALGAAAGAVNPAIGGMVLAIGLAVGAIKALWDATAKLTGYFLNLGKDLAKFSPSMAAVFARSELRERMRGIRQGESLAPDMSRLSDAVQSIKDSAMEILLPIQKGLLSIITPGVQLMAVGIGKAVDYVKAIVSGIGGLIGMIPFIGAIAGKIGEMLAKLDEIVAKMNEKKPEDLILNQFLRRLANGELNRIPARRAGP